MDLYFAGNTQGVFLNDEDIALILDNNLLSSYARKAERESGQNNIFTPTIEKGKRKR